ncbi:Fcf2 pre-rRNA processing-domain-containing protein [Chlamydoabsidia padenii]|nr:Fcf2 pre-rRNA processing-domain-containing protein [Chlamydoabsidia padenii]
MVVTTRRAAAKLLNTTTTDTTEFDKSTTFKSMINQTKNDTSRDNKADIEHKDEEGNTSNEEESDEDEDDDEEEEEEEGISSDEDDDDDDDDLNELLKKAQLSLRAQQVKTLDSGDNTNQKNGSLKFPKLQPGISVGNELYIKAKKNGVSKLSPQVVEVVDKDESSKNNKALVTLHKIKQETAPLTRKERQLEREKTTGKGWFDMPLAEVTPEIKRDLQILKMRHVLDRKRHYKKMGKGPDPKYFQMGTIIEGATEFFSSRINKKDRKRTFAEELLSNDEYTSYYNRKYLETQERKTSGGKKHYKKLKAKRS